MLIDYESPLERIVHLEEPSDNAGLVSEGQEENTESVLTEPPAEPESFFTYMSDNGESTKFKDDKELSEYIRSGTLRHSDYTKKTQEVAETRKALEADKERYNAEYTTFLNNRQEYDKIEKYLKSLPPDIYNRLKQGINSQPRQQEFKDPRVDELIKAQETKAKQQEEELMRERAIENLSRTYSDFDKNSVMETVNKLQELAPGDTMRGFLELVYLANKGRISPAELERKTAEALEKKRNATTPMGRTVGTPGTGAKQYASLEEAAEAAHNLI